LGLLIEGFGPPTDRVGLYLVPTLAILTCVLMGAYELIRLGVHITNRLRASTEPIEPKAPLQNAFLCFLIGLLGSLFQFEAILRDVHEKGSSEFWILSGSFAQCLMPLLIGVVIAIGIYASSWLQVLLKGRSGGA
jgi:hypothetical protein